MSATIKLRCGGCDAEAETEPMRRTFHSFDGSGHGFGRYVGPDIEALVAQKGWTLFDIIGCTYCPDCTKKLDDDASEYGERDAEERFNADPNRHC